MAVKPMQRIIGVGSSVISQTMNTLAPIFFAPGRNAGAGLHRRADLGPLTARTSSGEARGRNHQVVSSAHALIDAPLQRMVNVTIRDAANPFGFRTPSGRGRTGVTKLPRLDVIHLR
jgi:hypothetical protein